MTNRILLSSAVAAALAVGGAVAVAQHDQHDQAPAPKTTFEIPRPLTVEHEHLSLIGQSLAYAFDALPGAVAGRR